MRAYRIAYDGTPFYGFQRQPSVSTVEGTIFRALDALGVFEWDGTTGDDEGGERDGLNNRPPGYAAAGRTDAGVSAVAQTIALEAPDWLTPRALNAELPADVRTWAMAEVPDDFHARHDATWREYTYHCYAPALPESTTIQAEPLVVDERTARAADALAGEHDFHNLTSDDERTVRTVTIDLERDGDYLVFTVGAPGFARGLVRRLVALIYGVATGSVPFDRIERALAPEALPGHLGVPRAPPAPLVLTSVEYPGVEWVTDERAAASAREVFDRKGVDHRSAARVARWISQRIGVDDG